jgi:hypothetical protein
MKLRIPITQQRNPFVVFARFRKAGPHEKPTKALRRQAVVALARIVKSWSEYRQKGVPMARLSIGIQIASLA